MLADGWLCPDGLLRCISALLFRQMLKCERMNYCGNVQDKQWGRMVNFIV